jgi:hypothetical protein
MLTQRYLFLAVAVLMLAGRAEDSGGVGPRLELRPGERYFRVEGRPAFVLGRNPSGIKPATYAEHFRHMAAASERFVRIHFTYMPPTEKPGEIATEMLNGWDIILDSAEQHGLAVLPVLGIWAMWNDGSNQEHWHNWDKNPFNTARGGPAQHPSELFEEGPCQKLWLQRTETLVKRWAHRRAIISWEVFSELDLVTGATPARAVSFAERAATIIRAADPWKRPVTASQAGINGWSLLLKSSAIDFIQIHPYADGRFGGRLDDLLLSTVRDRLTKYGKPVLIGESGLNSGPPHNTLDVAPRAEMGLRHAIWAAMVSGAMNGRAFWWQDGYDIHENADVCSRYHALAAPVAAFIRDVDFAGFAPIACTLPSGLKGAVLGNDKLLLGWLRDAACEPPNWPVKPITGQTVTVAVPGTIWQAAFFDPATGQPGVTNRLTVREGRLQLSLPAFQDALAVKLKRLAH